MADDQIRRKTLVLDCDQCTRNILPAPDAGFKIIQIMMGTLGRLCAARISHDRIAEFHPALLEVFSIAKPQNLNARLPRQMRGPSGKLAGVILMNE